MNLGLLKYLNLKTSDLTPTVIRDIANQFGRAVDVDEPSTAEIIKYLQANDVNAIADVLGRPEIFEKFKMFVSPVKSDDALIQCPHCSEFIAPGANN